MSRALRRAAAAAVLALVPVLAGCGSPVPPPHPGTDPSPVPALVDVQVHRVLSGAGSALRAADGASDAAALTPRADGATLQLRQAAYRIRAAVPTTPQPPRLDGQLLVDGVPAAGEWPRWFAAVERSSAHAVPELVVLTQTGPREPYRVSASATLLPGTTLPELAREGQVARAVAPQDAGSAAASPADAVARYADVLTAGTASRWASATADDVFRQQVLSEQDAERAGVSQYEAYASTHTPRQGAVWALRTQDGGALVVGVLDGTRTFTPRGPGIRQVLPADFAALAGRGDAPAGLGVRTAEVVALSVPPSGSGAPVRLVAGNRGLVGVDVR